VWWQIGPGFAIIEPFAALPHFGLERKLPFEG
jgi:hypothetical protein